MTRTPLLDRIRAERERQARSIHDEEVNYASGWVQRAQARMLPAKEYGR